MSSDINSLGMLVDSRIKQKQFLSIEHGNLDAVSAIVVHQTDGGSAQAAFNSYSGGSNGAHFLIDKDGTIYQTASLNKRCYHVGRLIRSKCLTIDRKTCNSESMTKILAMSWTKQINALDEHERAKSYPERYPVNSDSIGIELVGKHLDDKTYEAITIEQNASLQWLLDKLFGQFSLTSGDVYRHPEVSYKNPGEASSAQWK
jgi:N-acetyl-anhydromuramyl-L-alanine amidase AmpD